MISHSQLESLRAQFSCAPNAAQREAILHTGGPLYLPADPGSGKTRVLLWRTVNLIACHGVDPNAIFLATFTEKAAGQMREHIRAPLGAVTNVGPTDARKQNSVHHMPIEPDKRVGQPLWRQCRYCHAQVSSQVKSSVLPREVPGDF